MDILDDMGESKLSAKVFSKVNYSFNHWKYTMTKMSLSLFKLIISSHQYMIDLKNESCITYIDYLYEQYQDQTG